MAKERNLDLLGDIPLHAQVCSSADAGSPIVISDSQSSCAKEYHLIARKLMSKLSLQKQ
jgi:ATP-binding protein involved in chromosome partitioning